MDVGRNVLVAVHGGAGTFEAFPAARLERCRAGLTAGLLAGVRVWDDGGSAVDVAVAAVRVLEDDEEFNAGRGAVLTATGGVELDAAVADGATRRFGAVAVVTGVRNPVDLARAVLDEGAHVLVAGAGASALAARLGMPVTALDYFVTEHQSRAPGEVFGSGGGTVGAVARDAAGNLGAATSTGGRAGKAPGRIGDSPIPGAGTWAANDTCAVSATGDGEAFLRAAFAHEVDARIRLGGQTLADACRAALAAVGRSNGTGGCIALTSDGTLAAPFTSAGMLRGWVDADRRVHLAVFPDDPIAR